MAPTTQQWRTASPTVLGVGPQLDGEAAAELAKRLSELTGAGHRCVIVDLAGAQVGPDGFEVLRRMTKRMRLQGKALAIIGASREVRQLMGLLGLRRSLAVFRTREAAAHALSVRPVEAEVCR